MEKKEDNVKKKRVVTRVGNVFCVEFEDFKCYFQYVAKDATQLNSQVIKVFKTHYPLESNPKIEDIVNDEPAFFTHIFLRIWIHDNICHKVGTTSVNIEELKYIVFGIAKPEKIVSFYEFKEVNPLENWCLWKINKPIIDVGVLPVKYYDLIELGAVMDYKSVLERMKAGYDTSTSKVFDIIKRRPLPYIRSYTRREENGILSYYKFIGENLVKKFDLHDDNVTLVVDGENPELPKFYATNWHHFDFITEEEFNEAWNKYVRM